MSMPTERQVRDLFTTLRAFAVPTGKPPTSRLDDLEHRLITALTRDRSGATAIDGYPTSTLGDGRGGDITGGGTTANRAFTKEQHDKIHEHTQQAIASLTEAAGHLAVIERRLDLIDTISTPTPAADTAGTGSCQACDEHCPGTGEDRLRSGFCPACFKAWCRAGRPDRFTFKRDRRVPT